MELPVKGAHLFKVGNSYAIRIPMDYIKNGLVDATQKMDVVIKPVKKALSDMLSRVVYTFEVKSR